MQLRRARRVHVLAIYPTNRGFGYAVFQDIQNLLVWGRKDVRHDKNEQALRQLREIIDWHRPSVLVLPNVAKRSGRSSTRMNNLFKRMAGLAKRRKLVLAVYSREDIREAFSGIGALTKHEISRVIAQQIPELEMWLPPKRLVWMDEHPRMSIFDAVSIGFAYFHHKSGYSQGR